LQKSTGGLLGSPKRSFGGRRRSGSCDRRHRSCGPAGSDPNGASEESRFARWVGAKRRLTARTGNPKRAKHHEMRCSPGAGRKLGGPVGDVRLGYSFFENVGCTPEDRPHLANECARLTVSGIPSDLHPGPRALDGTRAVRVDLTVRRVAVRVVYAAGSRRERRVTAAFERMGEALRAPCSAPLNPVRAAGVLGSRVRMGLFGGFVRSLRRRRRDGGRCPIRRQGAPEIGDAGQAFSADGAEGLHARGACRHVRALHWARRDRPRSD
jgi:hypothetical protein